MHLPCLFIVGLVEWMNVISSGKDIFDRKLLLLLFDHIIYL